jgi:CRISPR-associated endonuclease/helicase Cas3
METEIPVYFNYWGKAKPSLEDAGAAYHLLPYHSLDVAAVGQVLLQQHPFLRKRLAELMQLPEADAVSWCVFLLGIHDLGKFAESFQQLRPDLRQQFWPDSIIKKKNYSVRHDSLGEMLWQRFLKDEWLEQSPDCEDFLEDAIKYWLQPVFGHHGWPPDKHEPLKNHFTDFDQTAALAYFNDWQQLINPDVEYVVNAGADSDWVKQQAKVSWILAGFAVLCDWLGSNHALFTYHDEHMDLPWYWQNVALPAAEIAIRAAGLLPKPRVEHQNLQSLFPFIQDPTPLQAYCSTVPISAEPQLFILEDVTGAGKTEAALMLAQRLMEAGQAEGIYVGLPTMATANAMYERMTDAYLRFYAEGSQPSLILSHSARHLSEKFQESLLAAQRAEQNYANEENITAQCNRWLADNRKKALLADVGIGTIDQALLGVMPARHQSLRLLGLLNKVLILDEVHAYDAYTNQLLKTLVEFHAALGGSIILLSATLTQYQREALIAAFYGKKYAAKPCTGKTDYPLLTRVAKDLPLVEQPLQTRESVRRLVQVQFCHDEKAVLQTIQQAVALGKSVCWIRNTVSDARDAWQQLAGYEWIESGKLHLFHSRYALHDRLTIERQVLDYFGKQSNPEQRQGRVLVATQVVEQSLDLDFDVMISDLAPIDLLIQRAGRLQRHSRDALGKPLAHGQLDQRGTPTLTVFSPSLTDAPQQDWYKQLFPKAHFVYPHTLVLWRTSQILAQMKGWTMPEDARQLLEFVYDEADEGIPEALAGSTQKALGETHAKKDMGDALALKLALGYTVNSRTWDEEVKLATRLGDDTHTVYLVCWQDGLLHPWVSYDRYCWDLSSVRVSCKQLAKAAVVKDAALATALVTLRETEKLFDQYSVILPLTLLKDDVWISYGLDSKERTVLVRYSADLGLVIEKKGQEGVP